MHSVSSADVIVFVCAGLLIILLLFGFIIFFIFSYRHKQQDYILLEKQKQKLDVQKIALEVALKDLKDAQNQLIQREKMASLGALTAGIAHEIQNPLNFVNNFSELNMELMAELKTEKLKPKNERDDVLENQILDDIVSNEEKIHHHGQSADAIVKGMLQHSRKNIGQKEPTDINTLCDQYLRLSYHGIRAKDKSFNSDLKLDFDKSIDKINVVPQDICSVLLNLFNNAFYACAERSRSACAERSSPPQPLKGSTTEYKPTVIVATRRVDTPLGDRGAGGNSKSHIEIRVSDNGNGIPKEIVDKIFQPFFTTKPTGQGTGLGLSLSYDIVKAHGGELEVETKENEGTVFTVILPNV